MSAQETTAKTDHPLRRESDQEAALTGLARMIDLRIPLWGVIGAATIALWALIGMYFQLQKVTEAVLELQITVRAGNNQATTLAGEIALLKFRLENLEGDRYRQNTPNSVMPGRR